MSRIQGKPLSMHQKNISVNQECSFATLLSSTCVMENIMPNFFLNNIPVQHTIQKNKKQWKNTESQIQCWMKIK